MILLKNCIREKQHVGTIIPNRKGLSIALKTAKGRQVLSSEFMWKNNSLALIVSFCRKPDRSVLLVLTVHSKRDVCNETHKIPAVIDFRALIFLTSILV